jgi:hypothetical protein
MNYTQDQIDAVAKEAQDKERARCIERLEEMRKYHSKTNPLNTDVTFILGAAIDELR